MRTLVWRRLRGWPTAGMLAMALSACAGTPRLPQCHGKAVPINAPTPAKESHGTRR
jgi:hypothetical protein